MEAGRLSWSNYISYPRIKSSFEKGFEVACSKGFFEHLWKSLVTCHCARLVAGLLLATSYALTRLKIGATDGCGRVSLPGCLRY